MEKSIRKLCYLSLFCAIAIVLSYIETLVPFYLGIPGAKIGSLLMLLPLRCFYVLVFKEALIVLLLRIMIVAMAFTNLYTFLYSLAGGILSLFIMFIFNKIKLFSHLIISIMGGVFHNIGQLLVAMCFFNSSVFIYYLPYLMLFGILSGIGIGMIGELILLKNRSKNY